MSIPDSLTAKLAEIDGDAASLATARATDTQADVTLASAQSNKVATAAAVVADVATLHAGKAELFALVEASYPEAPLSPPTPPSPPTP